MELWNSFTNQFKNGSPRQSCRRQQDRLCKLLRRAVFLGFKTLNLGFWAAQRRNFCPEGAFCVGGLKFFMFVRPFVRWCSQSDRDDRDRIAISGHISEIEHFWSKTALVNEPKFQICPISERYQQISDISADIRQISNVSELIIDRNYVIHYHRPRIVLLLACSVS